MPFRFHPHRDASRGTACRCRVCTPRGSCARCTAKPFPQTTAPTAAYLPCGAPWAIPGRIAAATHRDGGTTNCCFLD